VIPSTWPLSTSACRTHFRNVSGFIPNRPATVRIASYSEEYSLLCSVTRRIALALVSGSYCFGMAATFPIKKVRTKPGTLQIPLCPVLSQVRGGVALVGRVGLEPTTQGLGVA
jgi:hypothetical protein